MTDFRTRRGLAAQARDELPGIEWVYKIDGKLGKRQPERNQAGVETGLVVIGDVGYADDTAIVARRYCSTKYARIGRNGFTPGKRKGYGCKEWEGRPQTFLTKGKRQG
jgi:hypothetical protein